VFWGLFFPLIHWFFSLSRFVIPSKCLKNSIWSTHYKTVNISPLAFTEWAAWRWFMWRKHVGKLCIFSVLHPPLLLEMQFSSSRKHTESRDVIELKETNLISNIRHSCKMRGRVKGTFPVEWL
jgi:hypothetical protein